MGSPEQSRFTRILLLGSLALVASVSLAQLSGKLKTTFEKLQDTVQDDARLELTHIQITYFLPKATKHTFTLSMVTTNSVADARSGMNFGKQTRQAFTVEWENVKGITLESKYIDIKFKKAVATKVIEMDLQTGKEMKFEKQEKEVQIYFKKTSQAREATKLFNELRSALAK